MERRVYFSKLSTTAFAGLVFFAGCSSSEDNVEGVLHIVERDATTETTGTVEITVTVENPGEKTPTPTTLITRLEIQGGETYTRREEISVPPHESRRFTHTFTSEYLDITTPPQFNYNALLDVGTRGNGGKEPD